MRAGPSGQKSVWEKQRDEQMRGVRHVAHKGHGVRGLVGNIELNIAAVHSAEHSARTAAAHSARAFRYRAGTWERLWPHLPPSLLSAVSVEDQRRI